MSKKMDLHVHSHFSDGEYYPDDLLLFALIENVLVLGITDHDTLLGIQYLYKNKKKIPEGIEIIPGIELTAKTEKGVMHILGYGIDVFNKELNDKMACLKENSIRAFLAINKYLIDHFDLCFSEEDIDQILSSNRNIGRPDLAKLCVRYGKAKNVSEAFDRYLIEAHDATKKDGKGLPYQECLDLIINAGGIPVLAHPKTLKLDEVEFLKLLKEMIQNGLEGIEVFHSIHKAEDMNYYFDIAKKYELLISGGSDFHGENIKPKIKLGVTGSENNIVLTELSLVDQLREKSYKILTR